MKQEVEKVITSLLDTTINKDEAIAEILNIYHENQKHKPTGIRADGRQFYQYNLDQCPYRKIPLCTNMLSISGCNTCRVAHPF